MSAGTYAKQGGENVSAEIIIAGLSLLGTLAGTAGGIIVSGKLVNYRIEQLEKKVEKHNNLITRTFKLEQAVALLDERGKPPHFRFGKGGSRVNWKVRLRNPVFWVQIVVSAFAAVLAYAGLTAADLTTWESVGALLCNAVRNPYCLFLVLSSVWNAVNDPTTKGVADSERARSYDTPSR